MLQGAITREPFTDHPGVSGSRLEKVELADGTKLVVKHISAQWDWIMRGTSDRGREAQLGASRVLDRVADAQLAWRHQRIARTRDLVAHLTQGDASVTGMPDFPSEAVLNGATGLS